MYEKLKLFSGVNMNASKVKVPRFYPPISLFSFLSHEYSFVRTSVRPEPYTSTHWSDLMHSTYK